MEKALVYLQSGGPSPVINSSLYGVVNEARRQGAIAKIYGARYGVEGLISDNLFVFDKTHGDNDHLLLETPGSFLGSSRLKIKDNPVYFSQIKATLERHHIGYLLVNGGNDSMDTCLCLARFCKAASLPVSVIGIPKTIDNDLQGVDFAPGYLSAARHVINAVKMATIDARTYQKGKVILIETMGRDSGWLAAASDLLSAEFRPDFILLPERPFELSQLFLAIQKIYEKRGSVVIVLAEGVGLSHGAQDAFGHASYEGSSACLAHEIGQKLRLPTRYFSLSSPSRADPLLISPLDRRIAVKSGKEAVIASLRGDNGVMISYRRVSTAPLRFAFNTIPLDEVADKVRSIPASMLFSDTHLSAAFHQYLGPLLPLKNSVFPALSLPPFNS